MKRRRRKTVLLVEDDAPLRAVTREALEHDFRVVEAADCDEAIEAVRRGRIDIAIVDYLLPGGDGLGLLKELREIKPALPAILVTAYSTENLVIKALRAGATDYIRKPVRFSFLKEKIQEILQQSDEPESPVPPVSRDDVIIEGLATHIENHFSQDISLDQIAAMAGMNRYRFCRAFKKIMGESYTSYLNSVRVRNAADLIRNSELQIVEIAYAVGYNCVTYFERVFKSRYGVSPREFRRKGGETSTLLMQ